MNKTLVTGFFLLTTAYNCGQQTIEQRNITSVPSHNLSLQDIRNLNNTYSKDLIQSC